MPREGSRWMSLTQAAVEIDLSVRQLQKYSKLPGCPRKSDGKGGFRYEWPAFNRFVRETLAEEAATRGHPQDDESARSRKLIADAVLAELAVAEKEGTLIANQVHEEVFGEVSDRMRGVLQNIESNYTVDLERAGVPADVAQRVLGKIALDLTGCLRAAADDLDAE